MKFFDYTKLSFSALVEKIGKSRYFDLPAMLEEALNRLSGRVETLENTPAPSGGIETLSGDFVDNTDPINPTLDRGYKVYTALLTQSGTAAPVATVLENTLGGAVVWSRINTGAYYFQLPQFFNRDKTVLEVQPTRLISANQSIATNIYEFQDDINNLGLYSLYSKQVINLSLIHI